MKLDPKVRPFVQIIAVILALAALFAVVNIRVHRGFYNKTAIPNIPEAARLEAWYRSHAHSYFNDEMPDAVVRFIHDPGISGNTDYSVQGHIYVIGINLELNVTEEERQFTLFHEECHVWLISHHDEEDDQHGIKWQSCMLDLAERGAFKGLW